MKRTGKCLCGAVSYSAEIGDSITACHCGMCRRWSGGALMSAFAKDVKWQGEEHIGIFTSSKWAERGFCKQCGSGLFYKITAEGKFHGALSILFGTLDDQSGFTMTKEWFFDNKPDCYAFAGDRPTVTEAEALAMFESG